MFACEPTQPQNGIALIFDLEGFSKFFNQPDVADYLPVFLNKVSDAVFSCIRGGDGYWCPAGGTKLDPLDLQLGHHKFMGDGGLFVLLPPPNETVLDNEAIQLLCNRLWVLKDGFSEVLAHCADDVPVFELPPRIRFGVARGTVLELKRADNKDSEYVGFCINLASRLQKYCPSLGFIGSARLGIPAAVLNENSYKKVVATSIKGFPKEIVFVDEDELNSLDQEEFDAHFEELPIRT